MSPPAAKDLVDRLRVRGETVAVAESCTGGLVTSLLTDVAGASHAVRHGVVAYTGEAKHDLLGVDPDLLDEEGAVSVDVARAMAEGVRGDTTWALSTTGYAGPSGGTDAVPVGTVFVAVASATGTEVARHRFRGDRVQVKEQMARAALDELERALDGT